MQLKSREREWGRGRGLLCVLFLKKEKERKEKCQWTGKVEIRAKKMFWAVGEACVAIF